MAAEERPRARGSLATVVATAAVTLAIGVTAAALGGYLTSGRDGVGPPPRTAPTAAEAPTAAPTPAPAVVLVPVSREPASPSAPALAGEPPEVAPSGGERAHRAHGDDDDRGEGEREREREHDDDD